MLQNTEKYENHHEKSTSVLGPDVAAPKTSKKHEFYCSNTVQEHWRTPKSTRITTKNEHWRSWSAEKARKFTDETRFRPFQEHRRHTKSTRITTKNEHRRSWRAGNYENLQTKPARAAPPSRKLRKFTDETNMQARNHENSDEIRAPPVRHLDLATRPFTTTVRTPSVTTLFGEKRIKKQDVGVLKIILSFIKKILLSVDSIFRKKSLTVSQIFGGGLGILIMSLWLVLRKGETKELRNLQIQNWSAWMSQEVSKWLVNGL